MLFASWKALMHLASQLPTIAENEMYANFLDQQDMVVACKHTLAVPNIVWL